MKQKPAPSLAENMERLAAFGKAPSKRHDTDLELPTVFEVFFCDDTTGSFNQIAGPFAKLDEAADAFAFLMENEQTRDKKLFIVTVARRSVATNFDTKSLNRLTPSPSDIVQ
jgi:hypothetical protein